MDAKRGTPPLTQKIRRWCRPRTISCDVISLLQVVISLLFANNQPTYRPCPTYQPQPAVAKQPTHQPTYTHRSQPTHHLAHCTSEVRRLATAVATAPALGKAKCSASKHTSRDQCVATGTEVGHIWKMGYNWDKRYVGELTVEMHIYSKFRIVGSAVSIVDIIYQ